MHSLRSEVDEFIYEKGLKKTFISKTLGYTRQNFNDRLNNGSLRVRDYKKIAEMGDVKEPRLVLTNE